MKTVVYTDGACKGNPGPGGWAFKIIFYNGSTQYRSGYKENTTNNQMELLSTIMAGTALLVSSMVFLGNSIEFHTDSTYVKNGITTWINTWKRNGWKTSSGKPVKNQELWKELDYINNYLNIKWHWVPAHSGVPDNEEVDRLAVQAILEKKV